jgi:ABC-type branched-subunit amino acid transport system substrate-binding protein
MLWVLLALALSIVHADIYFGQSCALTGGSSFLGTQLRLGILAAFNETNAKGGVNGQLLQLVSLDDAYDPLFAAPNTQILAQNASMFALIGYVGTATAVAALPIALNYSIPLVGGFTGTPSLRSPFQRSVINIRAGYYDETAAMVNYLVNKRQVRRISIMFVIWNKFLIILGIKRTHLELLDIKD